MTEGSRTWWSQSPLTPQTKQRPQLTRPIGEPLGVVIKNEPCSPRVKPPLFSPMASPHFKPPPGCLQARNLNLDIKTEPHTPAVKSEPMAYLERALVKGEFPLNFNWPHIKWEPLQANVKAESKHHIPNPHKLLEEKLKFMPHRNRTGPPPNFDLIYSRPVTRPTHGDTCLWWNYDVEQALNRRREAYLLHKMRDDVPIEVRMERLWQFESAKDEVRRVIALSKMNAETARSENNANTNVVNFGASTSRDADSGTSRVPVHQRLGQLVTVGDDGGEKSESNCSTMDVDDDENQKHTDEVEIIPQASGNVEVYTIEDDLMTSDDDSDDITVIPVNEDDSEVIFIQKKQGEVNILAQVQGRVVKMNRKRKLTMTVSNPAKHPRVMTEDGKENGFVNDDVPVVNNGNVSNATVGLQVISEDSKDNVEDDENMNSKHVSSDSLPHSNSSNGANRTRDSHPDESTEDDKEFSTDSIPCNDTNGIDVSHSKDKTETCEVKEDDNEIKIDNGSDTGTSHSQENDALPGKGSEMDQKEDPHSQKNDALPEKGSEMDQKEDPDIIIEYDNIPLVLEKKVSWKERLDSSINDAMEKEVFSPIIFPLTPCKKDVNDQARIEAENDDADDDVIDCESSEPGVGTSLSQQNNALQEETLETDLQDLDTTIEYEEKKVPTKKKLIFSPSISHLTPSRSDVTIENVDAENSRNDQNVEDTPVGMDVEMETVDDDIEVVSVAVSDDDELEILDNSHKRGTADEVTKKVQSNSSGKKLVEIPRDFTLLKKVEVRLRKVFDSDDSDITLLEDNRSSRFLSGNTLEEHSVKSDSIKKTDNSIAQLETDKSISVANENDVDECQDDGAKPDIITVDSESASIEGDSSSIEFKEEEHTKSIINPSIEAESENVEITKGKESDPTKNLEDCLELDLENEDDSLLKEEVSTSQEDSGRNQISINNKVCPEIVLENSSDEDIQLLEENITLPSDDSFQSDPNSTTVAQSSDLSENLPTQSVINTRQTRQRTNAHATVSRVTRHTSVPQKNEGTGSQSPGPKKDVSNNDKPVSSYGFRLRSRRQ